MLNIGFIGLDTSHAPAFTRVLNTPKDPEHVPGGRVVAAFAGGSADFELSISRVEGFTATLRDEYGVKIVASPRDVAEQCNLVFITAADGRTHLDYLKQIAPLRRPVFVDKPLALSGRDAEEMFAIARASGFTLMSASSLRYADALNDVLAVQEPILGCDVVGPMALQPTQPGYFWYGIHLAEIAMRVMGAGCRRVQAVATDDYDLLTATWADGRLATLRGHRQGQTPFAVTVHTASGPRLADLGRNRRSPYARLVAAILNTLPYGRSDIPDEQTIEIVRMLEAANLSRADGLARTV